MNFSRAGTIPVAMRSGSAGAYWRL